MSTRWLLRRGALALALLCAAPAASPAHAGDAPERDAAPERSVEASPAQRASVADGSGAEAAGASAHPALSADGRFVAFRSAAANLVTGDTNGVEDVFVRDRQSGRTERVSVDSAGAEANAASGAPSLSADGRFVAFASAASNLVAGDTNGAEDVFVHDRESGRTERVSVSSSGEQARPPERLHEDSPAPALSADGRFVAFSSAAPNLVAGDTRGLLDVFVHDRQSGATERVSVSSAGEEADDESSSAAISADGRFVAFGSFASNLVPRDSNGLFDVFVRDRQRGTTERASVGPHGVQALRPPGAAAARVRFAPAHSLSADGRFVSFISSAANLVPGDRNGAPDVFVRDREAGTTERVSASSAGEPTDAGPETVFAAALDQALSADGRSVIFTSNATNLAGAPSGEIDVYVHDRRAGSTERVSEGAGGEPANRSSEGVAISAGGHVIAFGSFASNLVAGDANEAPDVFARERAVPELPLPVLALTPASAELAAGAEHCVSAALTDGRGAPLAGAAIALRIAGSQSRSAELETDAAGLASYCYPTAELPGSDAIEAVAQVGSGPVASASAAVRPPASSDGCKVEYLGQIVTAAGQPARLSGFALAARGDARGAQNYRDFAFRSGLRVNALRTDALVCRAGAAAIFGRAQLLPSGASQGFRIDLEDGGAEQASGRYRIRLESGYDSGFQPLRSGHVAITP